jgi:uncharacterized protein (TIGR02996 family)
LDATTMNNPIEAIEARIRANPTDTEAWKVYADWLLDQGDPRGELIMLELQPGATKDPALLTAIAELISQHRASWEPTGMPVQIHCEWLHGFVHAATLRDIGGAEDLRVLRRLFADPQARLLGTLKLLFTRSKGTKVFKPLAELDFGRLSWFRACDVDRGDKLVHVLVAQPMLRLIGLDLSYAGLTDAGLIELAACDRLRGLKTLRLTHNEFGPEGVLALANSPNLSELEELDLRYNAIGSAGADALANSPVLGRLGTLNLYADEIGEDGISALASSTTLSRNLVRFWQARDHLR